MRQIGLAFVGAVALSLSALGQGPTAADLARRGPQVGQKVPDFSLQDQDGRTRGLPSILRRNGAMLVFFRSAEW
jgi:hypothetical protein